MKMENKIGILTFHTALNYGAVLQTYALQKFLNNIGIDNEVIDYRCPYIEKSYKPFLVSDGKIINSIVRGIFFGNVIQKKRKVFQDFVSKNISTSPKYSIIKELIPLKDQYRYFITGSDQVWSPIAAGFDEAYFLPFVAENRKYSYAASIGTTQLTVDQEIEFKNRLKGFSIVSIREKSNEELIKKIDPTIEVAVHVDPTLLLSKSDWCKLTLDPIIKEPYLLIFNVEKPINNIDFAKKLAAEKQLKIVYINERTIIKDKSIRYIQAPSPEKFITLFANADAVVTNSFHGTVFSLIFQKDFYVELDNKKQRNNRVEALLEMVHISNREITSSYSTSKFDPINWQLVEEVLKNERENSSKYLQRINAMI